MEPCVPIGRNLGVTYGSGPKIRGHSMTVVLLDRPRTSLTCHIPSLSQNLSLAVRNWLLWCSELRVYTGQV